VNEDEKNSTVELGKDSRTQSTKIKTGINSLLSRHLAVLGSTGYGKSNFNAVLTQRIRKNFRNSRVVIFDINGEYSEAFKGFERIKETILGRPLATTAKHNGVTPMPPPLVFKGKDPSYHQIPYQAFGYAGLIKLLRPSDKTQLPALRNALKALHMVTVGQDKNTIWTGELTPQSNIQVWFELVDDCRQEGQQDLAHWLKKMRNNTIPQCSLQFIASV
jgi:hypothetical protein